MIDLNRLLDRFRHPGARSAAGDVSDGGDVLLAVEGRYCLLISHRRDGSTVATPVWAAAEGSTVYVRTERTSAKVRRIAANTDVLVAPCSARGRPLGPSVRTSARVLSEKREEAVAERALDRKYGTARRAYRRVAGEGDPAWIAIKTSGPSRP